MTEKQRRERIAAGCLWTDTAEYLAHQAKVKDLMYEFNISRPSEVDKRRELMKQMFGSVGDHVWINQPVTLAVGSTVAIGEGTCINSGHSDRRRRDHHRQRLPVRHKRDTLYNRPSDRPGGTGQRQHVFLSDHCR